MQKSSISCLASSRGLLLKVIGNCCAIISGSILADSSSSSLLNLSSSDADWATFAYSLFCISCCISDSSSAMSFLSVSIRERTSEFPADVPPSLILFSFSELRPSLLNSPRRTVSLPPTSVFPRTDEVSDSPLRTD